MRPEFKSVIAAALLAGVFAAPLAQASHESPEGVLVFPYVAVGGAETGWHFRTILQVSNPSATAKPVLIEIFDNAGDPLSVAFNGEEALTGKVEGTIPPQDSRLLLLTRSGDALHGGWMKLASTPDSDIQVEVVVQFYNGDSLIVQTGLSGSLGTTQASPLYKARLHDPLPAGRRLQNEGIRI